jgi:3',5'-cyclic-AMP phosphodiesterase
LKNTQSPLPPRRTAAIISLFAILLLSALAYSQVTHQDFRFAIVGDRTGEAQPGVYEQAWREIDKEQPDFVVTVGDTIQGLNDSTVDAEWRQVFQILKPYRRYPIYFTPGNHDVWSSLSAAAYKQYTKQPLHYSFDYGKAHFVVLEDHLEDARAPLPQEELTFLEHDLQSHAARPLKFVFSHRPFWLINAVLRDSHTPTQQLAERYGVQYVIAGHVHQMLKAEVQGITYLSMPSAAGHLRASKRYEDGWFFGHALVEVKGDKAEFAFEEAGPPFGRGRVSHISDWGAAGLASPSSK